ncbi:hypothetical protein PoB_003231300 [Plakobranchus ocellatus]|uniref:Uncharacterized protein n=1 Tax=Plakobranchus ocellatus TaxID=259542 RepID=A0AAV4AG96_9GAST|nr:hypothetical protein PoB_003231300 [Plakobranchus ocellatus]
MLEQDGHVSSHTVYGERGKSCDSYLISLISACTPADACELGAVMSPRDQDVRPALSSLREKLSGQPLTHGDDSSGRARLHSRFRRKLHRGCYCAALTPGSFSSTGNGKDVTSASPDSSKVCFCSGEDALPARWAGEPGWSLRRFVNNGKV